MKYEPYKMDSFKELMVRGFNDGNYSGRKQLFKITMEGEFEGFSGRATESWEKRFIVETPDGIFKGETLEQACNKAVTNISS